MKKVWLATISILLPALLLIVTAHLPRLPDNVGQRDFRAYWSASYLLSRSQNFADRELMASVQNQQTNWPLTPQMTWNPPWLLALFLPLAILPFTQAVWLWLLINIVFILATIKLIWNNLPKEWPYWHTALLFTALLPPIPLTFIVGQITTLALLGITLFVMCYRTRPYLAGFGLALITIKPQWFLLFLPIAALHLLVNRRWKTIATSLGTLIALTSVTAFFYPSFLNTYFNSVNGGVIWQLPAPTLPWLFAEAIGNYQWRLVGILFMPLLIWRWHYLRQNNTTDTLIFIELLLWSIIGSPYGFVFDFVLLLLPNLYIICQAQTGIFDTWRHKIIAPFLLCYQLLFWYQLLTLTDFYFLIPILNIALFLYLFNPSATATTTQKAYAS